MMRILAALALCLSGTLAAIASPGDTVKVNAHQQVDMTWYQAYRQTTFFPNPSPGYHRVNMNFTIGCATGGCSDWDYTVLITLLKPTGQLDSNVASIDTVSSNPLILDTVWNVFEVKEKFELGRMITPYGGYMRTNSNGYNNNWTHRMSWDVTDYQQLLTDSVEFEIFYQGWSSGFSATLDFELIEGTPPRQIASVSNLYPHGGFTYQNSATVEANHLAPVSVALEPGVEKAVLHVIPTGHGFNNAPNCAEFCQKDYDVKVNGNTLFTQSMWRDDCGLNPIYPQGGTWIYDRANWCPGTKALTYEHNISSALTGGGVFTMDLDIEPYNISAGQDPASYNWTTILLQISSYAHQHDVEIMDILSPSRDDEYLRMNPSCGRAKVRIRNKGEQALTSCVIQYGYEFAPGLSYNWTGNLGPMESEVVELPMGTPADWMQYQSSNRFYASAGAPNGQSDEYPLNNEKWSYFDQVPVHPADLRLTLRTNARGDETWWELYDESGALVQSGDNYADNATVNTDFTLPQGCYELRIHDRGKNGLSFWANSDGNGYARLHQQGVGIPLKVFKADFGTRINYWFSVGLGLGSGGETQAATVSFYPNPGDDRLFAEWTDGSEFAEVELISALGQTVIRQRIETNGSTDVSRLPSGMYWVRVKTERGRMVTATWIKR